MSARATSTRRAALTIGIPTFFLALAPSSGAWAPEQFVRRVSQFAVPAGFVLGTGLVSGYLFSVHDLDHSVADARTVAVTILVACGLYLVIALEASGSRRPSTLVAGMCAVLAGLYVATLLIPAARKFFALTVPDPGMIVTAVIASAIAIGALWLCGFSVGIVADHVPVPGEPPPAPEHPLSSSPPPALPAPAPPSHED